MLLTIVRLSELNRALDAARAASANSGEGRHCPAPHRGPDGETFRLEPKPRANRARLTRAGHEVVEVGGVAHVKVPLGAHGRGHLGIDPETGEVRCALCEGGE